MSWRVLDRMLRALGFNPTQVRWRIHRLRERSRRKARQMENQSRALRYQHQVCGKCGLTTDQGERRCPRCSARLHGPWARRLAVFWRYLLPKGSYTTTGALVVGILLLYGVMLTQTEAAFNLLDTLGSGISMTVLERYGAWTVQRVFQHGEVWRLATSCLLHFGLLHLIFNVLWLVNLGPLVEQIYGRSRFMVLTVLSGVFGMALSATYRSLMGQPAIGAGASGMVFGLIGVALVAGYLKKSPSSEHLRGGIGKWALYAILLSVLPGVDMVAHLGGGIAGGCFGLVLADRSRAHPLLPAAVWLVFELVCFLALVAGFFAALQ